MFSGKDSPILSDSEEEKDFYFSDSDWLYHKYPDLFLNKSKSTIHLKTVKQRSCDSLFEFGDGKDTLM